MSQDLNFAFAALVQAQHISSRPRTATELRKAAHALAAELCRQAQEVIKSNDLKAWGVVKETTFWCIISDSSCTFPPTWSIALRDGKFSLCHRNTIRYGNDLWTDPFPLITWVGTFRTPERWIEAALSDLRTYSP